MARYRARDDVPDRIQDRHPGSVWLSYPHAKKGPWLVRLDMTRVDGRLECCGLEIRSFREAVDAGWPADMPAWDENPRPLLRQTVRDLPLGAILSDLRRAALARAGEWVTDASAQGDIEGVEIAQLLRSGTQRAHGQRRRGIAPLNEVAAVYLAALNDRQPPTQAVAKHWHTPSSTAAKWVMHARGAGLLPEPTNRQKRATKR